MSPLSSATGRNQAGGSSPRSGCSHRISASRPTIRAGGEVDDRLKVQAELVAVQGQAQRLLDVEAVDRAPAQVVVDEFPAALPVLLGPVQGGARVAQQRAGPPGPAGLARAVRVGHRDTHGRRRHHEPTVDQHRVVQGGEHALGDRHRLSLVAHAVAHQGELVAGQAGGGVAATEHQLQAFGHLDEDDVAEVGTHAVVDDLEPVEVDAQDGHAGAGALRALEGLADAVEPEGAVRQTGERVVQGLVLQHLEREPGLGEIGDLQQRVPGAARLVGDGHQADRGVHRLAAGALVAALDVEALGPAGRELTQQRNLGGAVGGVEVGDRGAHEVGLRAPEHAREGGVDVQDAPVEGDGGQARRGVLGEREHVLLGSDEGALEPRGPCGGGVIVARRAPALLAVRARMDGVRGAVGLRAHGGDEGRHGTAVRRDRDGGDENLGGLHVVAAVGAVGPVLGADVEHGLLHAAAAQRAGDRRGEGGGRLGAEQGARRRVHAERRAVGTLDDDADADRVEQRVEQVGQLPGGRRHGRGLGPVGVGAGVAEPACAGMTRAPDEHAGLPRTITRSVWIVTLRFRCVASSERRIGSGGAGWGGARLGARAAGSGCPAGRHGATGSAPDL